MVRVPRRLLVPFCVIGAVFWAQLALAADQSFQVPLSGSQTVPPVESSGKGVANISYDPATRVVRWTISYHGLSGPVTMAHHTKEHPAGEIRGQVVPPKG
jgi:hypothetical protein